MKIILGTYFIIFLVLVAGVESVRDLHKLFDTIEPRYEVFLGYYQKAQQQLANSNGYTGMPRLFKIAAEFGKWFSKLPEGTKVSDKVDLATLTRFLEVMNVKYGSRWLSDAMFFFAVSFEVDMENPKAMAKALYESETPMDAEETGVTGAADVWFLIVNAEYSNLIPIFHEDFHDTALSGFIILGDMGLFTLEY